MPDSSRRIRFDGTINAGHLLTAGVLVLGMLAGFFRLEGRVNQQDIIIAAQREATAEKITALDRRMSWEAEATRNALVRIETGMQRIESKLDGKADKP